MPELTCDAKLPAVQPAVEDQPAAHPGPHEHQDDVAFTARCSDRGLAPSRRAQVVHQARHDAQTFAQKLPEWHVAPAKVGRHRHDSGSSEHLRGHPDAHWDLTAASVRPEPLNMFGQQLSDRFRSAVLEHDLVQALDSSVQADEADPSVGATQVDADPELVGVSRTRFGGHRAHLNSATLLRPRRALIRPMPEFAPSARGSELRSEG